MKIGILQERKIPQDRRVSFSPQLIASLQQQYKTVSFVVEKSEIRCYPDQAYAALGIELSEDLSSCDFLFGVKEIPVKYLIPKKSYFIFSHTIKKQPNNQELLQSIVKKRITLYDYEAIVDATNKRLIGFGEYAGIVGAYNALRLFGMKYELYKLPFAHKLTDKFALFQRIKKQFLPPIKIVVTGNGRVGKGISELLDATKIKKVTPLDFLKKTYSRPVYTILESVDYFKRIDGKVSDKKDFYTNPSLYCSDFEKYSYVSDILITGHFQAQDAPPILTRAMLQNKSNRIKIVADISCDVDGSIASTLTTSTIEDPFYGYLPSENKIASYNHPAAISVMAITNLPCELSKDASDGFGEMLANTVIQALLNNDKDGILERAKITENGALTERFAYLQNYVDGV